MYKVFFDIYLENYYKILILSVTSERTRDFTSEEPTTTAERECVF